MFSLKILTFFLAFMNICETYLIYVIFTGSSRTIFKQSMTYFFFLRILEVLQNF